MVSRPLSILQTPKKKKKKPVKDGLGRVEDVQVFKATVRVSRFNKRMHSLDTELLNSIFISSISNYYLYPEFETKMQSLK